MSRQLLPSVSFVNVIIMGRGKVSLGRIRLKIGVSIENFLAVEPLEFLLRGNSHINKLLQ
jgi:hypothetical protein